MRNSISSGRVGRCVLDRLINADAQGRRAYMWGARRPTKQTPQEIYLVW
ncbi:MAG: hypothetical protein GX455_14750 [Phycisphaerae bacterium]|nr:hypothetical protein [Phycisphaerae bacterium]